MTRLMSNCTSAMVAAKIAVTAPTMPTTSSEEPAATKSGIERATRYTPDVTIVAAWMSAETTKSDIQVKNRQRPRSSAMYPFAYTKMRKETTVTTSSMTADKGSIRAPTFIEKSPTPIQR